VIGTAVRHTRIGIGEFLPGDLGPFFDGRLVGRQRVPRDLQQSTDVVQLEYFRAVEQTQRHVVERTDVDRGDIGIVETLRIDTDPRHRKDFLLFVVVSVYLAFDEAAGTDHGHGTVGLYEFTGGRGRVCRVPLVVERLV